MTREEYAQIVRANRFSSLTVNSGDPLRDPLEEIYWEGYKAGYCRAINDLQMLGPRIFNTGSKSFFQQNIDKIKCQLEAIRQIDDYEKESDAE